VISDLDHDKERIKEAAITVLEVLREYQEKFDVSQLISTAGTYMIWLENPCQDNLSDVIDSKDVAWRAYHQEGNLGSLETVQGNLARSTWLVGEAIWHYSKKDWPGSEDIASQSISGVGKVKDLLVEV